MPVILLGNYKCKLRIIMADQQYSQYPAGQAGYSYGSYTGDSSNSQSGYGSANTGAYTIEDLREVAKVAVKARKAVRAELHDCQTRLQEVIRCKNEVESRCLELSRAKSAIQTRLEEGEKEIVEVKKKYKAVLALLSEVCHKLEHLAGQSEGKKDSINRFVRYFESKLELDQTWLSRLEGSSSGRCGGSSAPAGNVGYGSYGANQYVSNQSQYGYGQQPSASSYSTANIHRITSLKSRYFATTSIHHRFIHVGGWRLRRTRRYDRGNRGGGGGGYGINEKVDELPQEPPAETLRASCSFSFMNSTSRGENRLYCINCGFKHDEADANFCSRCGQRRFS